MSFQIDRIAALANLQLNEREQGTIIKNMKEILCFVETITNLNIEPYEPHLIDDVSVVLREDVVGTCLSQEDLALNVPILDQSSIIVPQVIQK